MGLSRLEAFLKSVRGNLLHVDPNSLDSTDSIENDGSSQMLPFKSLNRALIEAARFSYQAGLDNDRFGRTTILIYPGQHIVDNRPGAIIQDNGNIKLRGGNNTTINQWSLDTVYDLTSPNNDLYKLNSVHGGLILPRGVSIVAKDLRKTVIRPLYVPDPLNEDIERSAIFRLTGASFLYGFSVLDADPNGIAYKDYTTLRETPTFSHHKLTCFEYADGVNDVVINDTFNEITTSRTDLEMYYEKVALVYGSSSGRDVPDPIYSTGVSIDIQPVVDEFRIVGSRGKDFQISQIRAGNGFTPTNIITVTTTEPLEGISVDTPIQVSGVNVDGYDGQFVVFKVLSTNQLQYKSKILPSVASPQIFGANFSIVTDTVSSASPYIFNVSLRSVYGMCGLHADGSKADGFKSMVVAQFTGIGIQKDDNAFVLYDESAGVYRDSVAIPNLYKNSRARFKPEYENYHIKVSEGGFCQLVSIFAIGFANHFLAESGGDYSITNSNSNFGAKALVSDGFSRDAFPRDDVGFITKIIPPRDIESKDISIEFNSIDVSLTIAGAAGAATTNRLYLYAETDFNNPPRVLLDGYRIGAAKNEILYLENSTASVVIPDTNTSYEKSFNIARINNDTENDISSGIINFTQTDNFVTGEKVRVISDNGYLPDGIEDRIYYVIDVTSGTNNQIRLAETFDSALNGVSVANLNTKGGRLRVVSRVSDKDSGEIGHPVQWDSINSNWYITVAPNSSLYNYVLSKNGVPTTNRSYIKRTPDRRNVDDTIYKFEYILPKESPITARPPIDGYVLQKSNKSLLGENEISSYFSDGSLENVTQLRSPKYISNVTWNSGELTIFSELDHNVLVGSKVKVSNVIPKEYNKTYTVKRIINSKAFIVDSSSYGVFSNDISTRDLNLPFFQPKETFNTYKLYSIETIQDYIPEKQDGIYELVVLNNSVSPIVSQFRNLKLSQPVKNLYPQIDRDNPISDPQEAISFAKLNNIGEVTLDNPENSITKETLNKFFGDFNVGFGVTSIVSNSVGTSHTIFTSIDHGLSEITSASIVSTGSSYIPGTYYGVNLQGTTTGVNAKVAIEVNANGNVSSLQIMDGGSRYVVGNTLSLIPPVGIGTTSGFVPATVEITSISDNIGDVISISGYSGINTGYNNLYRITSIPENNRIVVASAGIVTNFSTSLVTQNSTAVRTGKIISISSLTYDRLSGIGTIVTSSNHNLKLNQKLKLDGFNQSFYNKEVYVSNILSPTSIQVVGIGTSTTTPGTAGSARRIFSFGYNISERGNKRGRLIYDGVIGANSVQFLSTAPETTPIVITNAVSLGLKIGDYLEVNGEILRIKSPVTSNNIFVFRAQLGSIRRTHPVNSVIQRIRPIPVEFRRNTIIRASGHTFEYVGFGPGNYSTAFPEKQDRKLSDSEKFLSQSLKSNGGVVYYSGTDDAGDFYAGNKKTTSATGKEELFDTPIQNFTGDESATSEIVKTNDVIINRSIRVGGGKNKDVVSEFDGPIILNNKLTSYSPEGIETPSLFLQGDQEISRRYSISSDIPDVAGNYGDIIYRASPNEGQNIGWVYTTSDRWRTWGYVGDLGTLVYLYSGTENGPNVLEGIVDKIKFVGDPNGFGIDVDIKVDPIVGFGTIVLRNPIDIINFGTGVLGTGTPTFTNRSAGNRIVYENSLSFNRVDYAVGVSAGTLWNSIPRNTADFFYRWYGGETELMSLSGLGRLTVFGGISGNLDGDVNGNATTATTASNLTRTVTAGNGLTGGGTLNGQDITLDVGQGSGISVTSDAISVDSTVVRTSGNQEIGGVKNFTSNIIATGITASGIVTANTFSGGGIIPIGGIIMWSGTIGNIPNRWQLCNGTNGTPDLRDRFIVGAGNEYSPGNTGGVNSVALTVEEMPSHNHTGTTGADGGHNHTGTTGDGGAHTHTGKTNNTGSHTHTITVYETNKYASGNNTALDRTGASTGTTGSDGSHEHTLTINEALDHTHSITLVAATNHTHSVTIDNRGGSAAHENRPPYYALAYIMRIS
jgi:microcystin-dependent protein